jgi:hypothetical protein
VHSYTDGYFGQTNAQLVASDWEGRLNGARAIKNRKLAESERDFRWIDFSDD